ncbi:MAG: crossover junction endodeoxyribonuclease RuvC [Candidatus Thorarchaeota archaeon]|jgi:Holliday junction resolvasome RuvABC endonuclease subunit
MKLKIKDLEKKLGKKIKKNFLAIGIDTASKLGLGYIHTTKKEVIIDWALLEFHTNTIQELYKQMYVALGDFILADVNCCVIEDVFLGMNPDTTIKLARFGGLALAHAIDNKVHFETIGAKSARAKLFKIDYKKYKGKTKQAVADYLKSIGIKIDEDNCADGLILALLGIIEGMDFRSKAKINKLKKKRKGK